MSSMRNGYVYKKVRRREGVQYSPERAQRQTSFNQIFNGIVLKDDVNFTVEEASPVLVKSGSDDHLVTAFMNTQREYLNGGLNDAQVTAKLTGIKTLAAVRMYLIPT